MATKTFYVTNTILDNVHQEMSETSPGSEATSSPNYGWLVGTTAPTVYAPAVVRVENNAFLATPVEPDGSIMTDVDAGDCWRSTNKLWGDFSTGNWTFQMQVIAVTQGAQQDGNAGFRLFRSANADGSGATEITSGRLGGGAVTNLLTSAAQTSSHTSTSITGFSLSGEYLFVQVGWEITGAGNMSTSDVIIRIGTGASLVTTTDFSPAADASEFSPLYPYPEVSPIEVVSY